MSAMQLPQSLTFWRRALVLLILAILFTRVCVHKSTHIGRLSTAPNYDDTVYFQDGALLDLALKTDGVRGFRNFLDERGLHSPYSVFLAAASFATFGYRATSPYYADGLLVLLYLICVGWIGRRLPFGAWTLMLILFLTPPFITMGVVEFRPDIAWATTTGFGVVLIVTSEKVFRDYKRAALAGLFLGLAFLIKPTTFVMTTILYSGAILSRILPAIYKKQWRTDWKNCLGGAAILFAIALLIAGPYWARFGGDSWHYFMENSFGANKSVWLYRGTRDMALWFYITGDGASSNVSVSGMIITLVAVNCALWLAATQPSLRWRILVLLALGGVALFINTVAQMKSPFLGGGIYGVWIFSSAYVLATVYPTDAPREGLLFRRRLGGRVRTASSRINLLFSWTLLAPKEEQFGAFKNVILATVTVAAVISYRWPTYSNWGDNRTRCKNYAAANDFMKAALDKHAASPPKGILFMQAGPIVMENAGFWFPVHGLKTVVNSGAFFRDTESFKTEYPKYEWIVLQEPDTMGSSPNMPSEPLLPEFFDILKSDPNYKVLSEFTAFDGKKVWIVARNSGA